MQDPVGKLVWLELGEPGEQPQEAQERGRWRPDSTELPRPSRREGFTLNCDVSPSQDFEQDSSIIYLFLLR